MELTNDERLAFLEALNKKLNDKNGGLLTDAKAEERARLLELHDEYGVDRKALMCGGVKVGETVVTFSKPKPYIFEERRAEALQYLLDLDLAEITPKRGWEESFANVDGEIFCMDTGEVVDWAGWEEGHAKTAMIRGCKPQEVLKALGPKLSSANITRFMLGE